jgi:hypothetical protein
MGVDIPGTELVIEDLEQMTKIQTYVDGRSGVFGKVEIER